MRNKLVWLGALALIVIVGAVLMQRAGKNETPEREIAAAEKIASSGTSPAGGADPAATAQSPGPPPPLKTQRVRHPFPDVPRTREGMSFENDPSGAESKAEQAWLDRHGYPNEKQWEADALAPEVLLRQATEAGNRAAQAMLDARLLPADVTAQQRAVSRFKCNT
ncbi:hypothetical protein [Xanthomonas theicola]|uniref:hypothetical protein n=1 Tax=Xanthomonas theicola TaxID=56464 RepID=UPI001FE76C9C|nr:hypothetical protein [Xanthomonas theicola]